MLLRWRLELRQVELVTKVTRFDVGEIGGLEDGETIDEDEDKEDGDNEELLLRFDLVNLVDLVDSVTCHMFVDALKLVNAWEIIGSSFKPTSLTLLCWLILLVLLLLV